MVGIYFKKTWSHLVSLLALCENVLHEEFLGILWFVVGRSCWIIFL